MMIGNGKNRLKAILHWKKPESVQGIKCGLPRQNAIVELQKSDFNLNNLVTKFALPKTAIWYFYNILHSREDLIEQMEKGLYQSRPFAFGSTWSKTESFKFSFRFLIPLSWMFMCEKNHRISDFFSRCD